MRRPKSAQKRKRIARSKNRRRKRRRNNAFAQSDFIHGGRYHVDHVCAQPDRVNVADGADLS